MVVGETGLVPSLTEWKVLDSVHSILRSCVLRQCSPVKRQNGSVTTFKSFHLLGSQVIFSKVQSLWYWVVKMFYFSCSITIECIKITPDPLFSFIVCLRTG